MSIANGGNDHGMYVWRDPRLNGYPIDQSEISQMIAFAKNNKIKRILYDNWGTGKTNQSSDWSIGTGQQPDYFLNNLISNAHDENILVEALYTDNLRFQKVVNHNKDSQNKFDGIRMNYEGPWNLGPSTHSNKKFHEPVSNGDIEYFATAKRNTGNTLKGSIPKWVKDIAKWWADGKTSDEEFINTIQYLLREGIIKIESTTHHIRSNAKIPSWVKKNAEWWAKGTISDDSFVQGIQFLVKEGIIQVPTAANILNPIPLYASISWHWGRNDVPEPDHMIQYNNMQKFAYQHILDIVDGVDIQTAWGGANAVDAILFRVIPIIKYARNLNKPAWITIETSDRAPPNQTFADEGMTHLESTVNVLLSALKSQNTSPAGIIYHFYMNKYK